MLDAAGRDPPHELRLVDQRGVVVVLGATVSWLRVTRSSSSGVVTVTGVPLMSVAVSVAIVDSDLRS